jgi:NADPH2:quinone reductase
VKPQLPFSPGGEVAGTICAVGEDVDGTFVLGDRVMALTGYGGMAEQVCAPVGAVQHVPAEIEPLTAAVLTFSYGTSLHALRDRAHLRSDETLLVLGAAGGVGLAAVELGHVLGARVIAAASSTEKLELCRTHGADELLNYTSEDFRSALKALTGGRGADVIFDPVGGPYTEPALRSMAWGGRYLVVGFAAGEIPRIPLNLPLLKGFDVVGVYWGSLVARDPARHNANMEDLKRWCVEGQLRPHVSATFPLERAGEAIRQLADRRATGKLVVIVTPPAIQQRSFSAVQQQP